MDWVSSSALLVVDWICTKTCSMLCKMYVESHKIQLGLKSVSNECSMAKKTPHFYEINIRPAVK